MDLNTAPTSTVQERDYVQDTIGHWYQILEVQNSGWRFKVDAVYDMNGRFVSYGYRPVIMGRSEFKFSR